jgi:hypothetical protein
MPEATRQTDENSNDDSQRIDGETATATIKPFGPRVPHEFEIDLDGGMALGSVKQEAREKGREAGYDVFHVSKVNGKVLDQSDGGFHETQPEDVDLGGESA